MHEEETWQTALKFMAILVTAIALVFILKTLKGIFIPLVLAVFLTYLFAPVVELLVKLKIPRVLSLFILLAVLIVIGRYFVQILVNNTKEFIALLPTLENELTAKISALLRHYLNVETKGLVSILQSTRVSEMLSSLLNQSFSFFGKALLTLLILIFIYMSYSNYPYLIKKAFDKKRTREIFITLSKINEQITQYFIVKTLISCGTGVLTGIACGIMGVKFTILWAFLSFFLNYIPYLGSFLAVVLPIVLSIFQFPASYMPLVVAVTLIVIQLFMGNFLDPEMMGNRFNLSPIVIIFSLFFWGYVWGVVGTFIAVPLMATVKIVIQNIKPVSFLAVLMSKKAYLPENPKLFSFRSIRPRRKK